MTFRARLRVEEGQSVPEYALLLACVTALLVASCTALGVTVSELYGAVTSAMP